MKQYMLDLSSYEAQLQRHYNEVLPMMEGYALWSLRRCQKHWDTKASGCGEEGPFC